MSTAIPNDKTNGEPYLESWRNSLDERILKKKELLEKIEKDKKKVVDLLQTRNNSLSTLHSSMEDVLQQMRQSIKSYAAILQQNLEEYTGQEDDYDQKEKGDKIFELFQKMHKNACHFFSRTDFSEVISPLHPNKTVTLYEFVQQYFKEAKPPKLEEENWIECKSSIWSLHIYYIEIAKQYGNLEKEIESIEKTEVQILEKQQKTQEEYHKLVSERKEVEIFSKRIQTFRQSPNSTTSEYSFNSGEPMPEESEDET